MFKKKIKNSWTSLFIGLLFPFIFLLLFLPTLNFAENNEEELKRVEIFERNFSFDGLARVGNLITLDNFFSFFDYLFNLVVNNWRNFFRGQESQDITYNTDLRESIRAEVLAELRNNNPELFKSDDWERLAFLEAENQRLKNLLNQDYSWNKENLAQIFSDPVEIKWFNDGRSGVIIPLINKNKKENYLFVILDANKND